MNYEFGLDINDLFRNEHEALTFAFNFQSQQYPLSPMSKLGGVKALGTGKGLVSVDGAAQAGLLRKKLSTLDPLFRNCLTARFSPKYDQCPCCHGDRAMPEWVEAIAGLRYWSQTAVSGVSNGHVREAIIKNYFDKKTSITDAADRAKVPVRNVHNQRNKIHERLKQVEAQALAAYRDAIGIRSAELQES
jgi:hypothetical protein